MEELAYNNIHLLIVPTVLIPLTMVSVGISVVATFVAGLFGITLKAEGPKRLLELLLKPKIIFMSLLLNSLIMGGIWGYRYVKNLPKFIYTINKANSEIQKQSSLSYQDVLEKKNIYKETNVQPMSYDIQVEKEVTLTEGGSFRAGPFSADSFFLGTTKGYVLEIQRETLEVKRKFFTGTFVTPMPVIWNNKLLFGEGVHDTHHARVYQFDLATGRLDRYFTTKGHTEGQAIIGRFDNEERLFIVAGADGFYSLDAKTFEVKWHANDGHSDSAAVVHNGSVFLGTGREKENLSGERPAAIAYDFLTGKKIWKHELVASSWMKPVLLEKEVCFIYGEIYFETEIGGVQCFDQVSGNPTQDHRLLATVASIPMALNNDLIVSDVKGNVYRIDTQNRKVLWTRPTHDPETIRNYTSVSYDSFRNVLLYGSLKDGLYVLNPKNGEVLNHWKPEKPIKFYAGVMPTKEGWYIIDMKGSLKLLKPNVESISRSDN